MSKIQNVLAWLVTSSADPAKTALTIKGFLTTIGGIILLISPLIHIHLVNDQVTAIIDATVQLVTLLLTAFASVVTIFAFVRKVMLTDWKNSPPTTPQA